MAGGVAALLAVEGLKKSEPFAATIAYVTKGLNWLSASEVMAVLPRLANHKDFVLQHADKLRRLAARGEAFRWIDASLDWLRRRGDKPEE